MCRLACSRSPAPCWNPGLASTRAFPQKLAITARDRTLQTVGSPAPSLHLPPRPTRHQPQSPMQTPIPIWLGDLSGQADGTGRRHPRPCFCRRARAWRRDDRAGAGKTRTGRLRPCARRLPFRRRRSAGGGLLLLARSQRRASRSTPGELCRNLASRRSARLQLALYAERSPAAISEVACCSHGRRKFFVLPDIARNAGALSSGDSRALCGR